MRLLLQQPAHMPHTLVIDTQIHAITHYAGSLYADTLLLRYDDKAELIRHIEGVILHYAAGYESYARCC